MFDHLIGNSEAKQTIARLIAAGRIPNSMLFAGPEGVGKQQFALEVARTIVCREPRQGEACNQCAACRRVSVFEFPDADDKDAHKKVIFSEHADVGVVIPYKQNVLVDSIRDLEREANFRPFEAPARVFIIDDAHKMNDSASNALLKTLEEPPSTSHIFLITSKPNALLPTIRSRVQMLRFAAIETSEIERYLLAQHSYSQEDARSIAAASGGSLSRAISIEVEDFREMRQDAIEIVRSAIVDRDFVALLKKAEKLNVASSRSDFEEFLDVLQTTIHEVWSVAVNGGADDRTLIDLAEAADPKRLADWLQVIEEIRENMRVNINKKIATDALFIKMAAG